MADEAPKNEKEKKKEADIDKKTKEEYDKLSEEQKKAAEKQREEAKQKEPEPSKPSLLENIIGGVWNKVKEYGCLAATTLGSIALVGPWNTLAWTGGHYVAAWLTKSKKKKDMNKANFTAYPLHLAFGFLNSVKGFLARTGMGLGVVLPAFTVIYQTVSHLVDKYTPTKFTNEFLSKGMIKGTKDYLKKNAWRGYKNTVKYMAIPLAFNWNFPETGQKYFGLTLEQAKNFQIPIAGAITPFYSMVNKPKKEEKKEPKQKYVPNTANQYAH